MHKAAAPPMEPAWTERERNTAFAEEATRGSHRRQQGRLLCRKAIQVTAGMGAPFSLFAKPKNRPTFVVIQ
jgi:hypothetical protein